MRMTAAAVSACIVLGAAVLAQDAPRAGQVFGDWRFDCTGVSEDRSLCRLTQTMVSNEARKPVARLSIAPHAKGGLTLAALLPLGLSIPAGVRVAVDDGEAVELTLTSCVSAGCVATHRLTDTEIAAMRAGTTIDIRYELPAGRAITVPGSLRGISAGLAATGW